MAFQFVIATPSIIGGPTAHKMITALGTLGLTSNLKLCLDAGDSNSVAVGSQTKWLDVAGSGYDFFPGVDGTSEANEPSFSGTPGSQSSSEYYTFSGDTSTGRFTYDTTNETWMDALHKDNAVWTLATWLWVPSHSGTATVLSTIGGTATGVTVAQSGSSDTITLTVFGGGVTKYSTSVAAAIDTSGWQFVALAVDEANNAFRSNISGAQSSATCTYSSPSSSAASGLMRIGTAPLVSPLPNLSRMSSFMMWEGTALTATQLDAIYQYTRVKFAV